MIVKRRQKILEYLASNQTAAIDDLSVFCATSPASVRRDLLEMEKDGLIDRVRGGAVLKERSTGNFFLPRAAALIEAKKMIGQAAASLVSHGDTIIITGGTTTEEMIPCLANFHDLTVITNALNIAYRLSSYEHIRVIVLGGLLRHREFDLVGHKTEEALHDLVAIKLFRGIFGVHPVQGLTGTELLQVQTDKSIMEKVEQFIILADHSKFNKIGPIQVAPVNKAAAIVTDSKTPLEKVEAIRKLGVRVIQA